MTRRAFRVDWKQTVPTEADVERDILKYLHLAGYWARQTHSGKRRPVGKGTLDIHFGGRGIWGAIEVKALYGNSTYEQIEEMHRIRRAGGMAIEARSVEDVIAFGV